MAKEKEDYFVKIKNPREARKMLLENARDILKVLQGYEDFKRTRGIRTNLVNSFKASMDEIKELVQEIKRTLPKITMRETKVIAPELVMQKPQKELRKLEQELSDIETKLSEL